MLSVKARDEHTAAPAALHRSGPEGEGGGRPRARGTLRMSPALPSLGGRTLARARLCSHSL